MKDVGIVIIGRNEGQRLIDCLKSLITQGCRLTYVDSGSTDGSQTQAHNFGAAVVELDPGVPFSAGRARNAGLQQLISRCPDLTFVQFLDGDCELDPDWLATARAALVDDPHLAVVCGRRREKSPNQSLYNRLCDLEWDTPVGDALSCGGDALFRVNPFLEVGGYCSDLIAGEEPELCQRLREIGWKVRRLDCEMTRHDVAMTRFSQWWRRAVRAGHAFAEVAWRSQASKLPLWQRECRGIWFWGLALPTLILLFLIPTNFLSAWMLLAYPIQALRVAHYAAKRWNRPDSLLFGFGCMLAKFPQLWGMIKFHRSRWSNATTKLIEYKGKNLQPVFATND